MQAHRAETTLSEDGVITLRDIPFRRGESVEVIVLPFAAVAASGVRYPLRGTPVTLLAPWSVVEHEVRRVLDDGDAAGGGHVFNLGHGVLPQTDPTIITRVVEMVHGH